MRAHRSRLVPLYSKLGSVVRQIGHAEGARLEAGEAAVRVVRKVDNRYQLVGYQLRELLRAERRTPAMLTARDADILTGALRVSRGREIATQEKFKYWPDARNPQYMALLRGATA